MNSGEVFNRYKEQIKMAMMHSKVMQGEDDEGRPVYAEVSKEEALAEVVSIVDEMYFQLEQSITSGRALENLIHKHCPELDEKQFLHEYIKEVAKERLRDNGYIYEKKDTD